MSHLGLMSPCAKGNSWAPSSDLVGLRESTDLTPHPVLPLLSRCAATIPQAHSLEGSLRSPAEMNVLRQLTEAGAL